MLIISNVRIDDPGWGAQPPRVWSVPKFESSQALAKGKKKAETKKYRRAKKKKLKKNTSQIPEFSRARSTTDLKKKRKDKHTSVDAESGNAG